MRLFTLLVPLSISIPLWGFTTHTTQVADIETGTVPGEETLIFLSGGQVAKITQAEVKQLEQLRVAKEDGSWLHLTVDKDRYITVIDDAPAPYVKDVEEVSFKSAPEYFLTVISSPSAAQAIFNDARLKRKESQCYNRAHIWSYEWRVKHDIFSSKAWLFFTRKYIRKFNFEWWFHVSPALHVKENDKVFFRVTDKKYAHVPLKLKQWSDIFVKNRADCPVVNTYSEYANYPETGWCYTMKTSMYYYRPIDIEMLEKNGTQRQIWNSAEVRQAYKEAFDLDV
jgi:hypothetical protein